MQEQTTANQTSLQQPRTDLQTSAGNLQPGSSLGSGAGTSLNQTVGSQQLVVESQGQPLDAAPVSTVAAVGPSPWLLLLILPILVAIAVFWPKSSRQPAAVEELSEIVPEPVVPAVRPKSKKARKKSGKRSKSGRR